MFKTLKDVWSGRTSLTKAMLFYGAGISSVLTISLFFPAVDNVMLFVILAWVAVSLKITWSVSRLLGHGYAKAVALLFSQLAVNMATIFFAIGLFALFLSMTQDHRLNVAYVNLSSMERQVLRRMTNKYGITFPAGYIVRYVSAWNYGEEFGVDLVAEVSGEELDRWVSEVHPFGDPFQWGVQSNFPRFSIEWLCHAPPPEQKWREKLVIEDLRLSTPICGLLEQRREVYWAFKEVRGDWLVRITIFQDEELIWFHEVET